MDKMDVILLYLNVRVVEEINDLILNFFYEEI